MFPLLFGLVSATLLSSSTSDADCEFPAQWRGLWFHAGFPRPLNITGDSIDSKGSCHYREGDRFLIWESLPISSDDYTHESLGSSVDEEDKQRRRRLRPQCAKCMLIHEKHANVLQYKESYCDPPSSAPSASSSSLLHNLCQSITSDEKLFFMFRTGPEASPSPCPFAGVHAFSYSTRSGNGAERCEEPASHLERCTQPERMVFRFSACPDVRGSESGEQEMSCLASWSEGSARYLVGHLLDAAGTGGRRSGWDRSPTLSGKDIRCFRYESRFGGANGAAGVTLHMAQSFTSSCMGLWSVDEGARTFRMNRVSSELTECGFPTWFVRHPEWSSLDGRLAFRMQSGNSRAMTVFADGGAEEGGEMRCFNSTPSEVDAEGVTRIVVKHRSGCSSGFTCLELQPRHANVLLYNMGNMSRNAEDACSRFHFDSSDSAARRHLIADRTSVDCPFRGRYLDRGAVNSVEGNCDGNWINGGCPVSSHAQIRLCRARKKVLDFQCIGTWQEGVSASKKDSRPRESHTTSSAIRHHVLLLVLHQAPSSPGSLKRRRQRRHRHSLCASFDTNVSANDSVIRMAAAAESGVRVKLFNCDDGSTVTELKLRRVGPCHEALTDASSVNRARSICDPSMIVYVLIVSMSVISTSLDRR